jgi:hypothetical protein
MSIYRDSHAIASLIHASIFLSCRIEKIAFRSGRLETLPLKRSPHQEKLAE